MIVLGALLASRDSLSGRRWHRLVLAHIKSHDRRTTSQREHAKERQGSRNLASVRPETLELNRRLVGDGHDWAYTVESDFGRLDLS